MFLLFGFYWLSSRSSKSIINFKKHLNNLPNFFPCKDLFRCKVHCNAVRTRKMGPIRPLDYSVSCHINLIYLKWLWSFFDIYCCAYYLFLENMCTFIPATVLIKNLTLIWFYRSNLYWFIFFNSRSTQRQTFFCVQHPFWTLL